MGATQTRCAQTCVTLFPFFTAHHWPGSNADKINPNGSLRIALTSATVLHFSTHADHSLKFSQPSCCASSAMRSEQFGRSRLCLAGDVLQQSKKEGRMSELSEFAPLPIDATQRRVPRRSDESVGTVLQPFICLLSLTKQRK